MEKKVSGKHSSMNGFAMMKGRVVTVVLASALLLGGGLTAQAQNAALTTCSQSAATAIPQNPNWKANAAEWQKLKGEITLYMTNDMGRNGYYDQKPIAELMGEMAGTVDGMRTCRGRHPPFQWRDFYPGPSVAYQLRICLFSSRPDARLVPSMWQP